MPMQFQGVAVDTLPGAREGRPDGLHALLEPAAAALKDPQPHVGPGLPEEREMNAEPVVFPGRGAALAEEFLQPLLAVRGQPVHLLRPASRARARGRSGPGRAGRLGLVVLLYDQPVGEKLLQARVQRPVGERTEGAEHGVQPLAQLIAVHRRFVQRPEHGKLEYAGAITPHAAPNWWLLTVNPGTDLLSVCYISLRCVRMIVLTVRSSRCIAPIYTDDTSSCPPPQVRDLGARRTARSDVRWRT